ncbi:MAG: glycosyltransferase family 4 protein [Gemmatimonadaceae bacterium]
MRELSEVRVAFLAGTLGQGGAERQLYYMLAALRGAGASPRVLSLTQGEHWQSRIESLGVPVHWVGQSSSPLERLRRIVQELRRSRADIIQSQHFFANGYAVAAARLLGMHEIGAIRGDGFEELESNPGLFGWCSLRLPRYLAANSKIAMENAVSALGAKRERLFFVPNVVDTFAFAAERRPQRARVILMAVGSLVAVKRLDRFVRAVAALRHRTGVEFQARIVGDGPLRAQLESLGRELGLTPQQLQFCGSSTDINSMYRDADLLILTSDREGTPNVILEAMASGLPVVATRVGGVAALVRDDETGYVVERNDAEALVTAIQKLVEAPEQRVEFGNRGRRFVEQNHRPPQLATALRVLYDGVLSMKREP